MSEFCGLLQQKVASFMTLSDVQLGLLQAHYELLLRWNQALNLTRIDSLEDAVERHYAEGLFLASRIQASRIQASRIQASRIQASRIEASRIEASRIEREPGQLRIADIGSGAGFPGFPVAVARPDCKVSLIESHQRKAVFLREATRNLANVRVCAKRAEEVEDEFDLAISRAVSYDDLRKPLRALVWRALARRAYLLTGAEEPPEKIGFVWEEPSPLPWGKQRFLRIGRAVSRETATT
jgi:16S rRNA G527 N7-methylase RsmG